MGGNRTAPVPTAAYGAMLPAASLAYWVLLRTILAAQGPQSQLAAAVGSDLKGKLSPVFYTLALAFVRPWIADGLYALVALL